MGKFKLYNVDLKNLSPGVHEFEYLLENKFFVDIDGTEVQKGKVKVNLTVKRSSMMFEMNFQIEGVVMVPCDRCLEPVATVFNLNISRITKGNVTDESEVESEDLDEANYIDGYTLDVDQLVGSEILIGWPTKILCSEDCKGICNVCGQNLNQGTCNCEDTSLDPRMSVIRDVFKNFKEV